MRQPVLAAALMLAGAAANAQDCEEMTAQSDLTQCMHDSWKEADAELNQVYGDLVTVLEGWDDAATEVEGPRKAQRAWVAFRDAECQLAGFPMRGGSGEPMLVYGCMDMLTRTRIVELQDLLEYGDM